MAWLMGWNSVLQRVSRASDNEQVKRYVEKVLGALEGKLAACRFAGWWACHCLIDQAGPESEMQVLSSLRSSSDMGIKPKK